MIPYKFWTTIALGYGIFIVTFGIGAAAFYFTLFKFKKRDLLLIPIVALIGASVILWERSHLAGYICMGGFLITIWYYIRPALKAGIWPINPTPDKKGRD